MESLPYSKQLLTASGVFLLPDNSLILGDYHELVARDFCNRVSEKVLYNIYLEELGKTIEISDEELRLLREYKQISELNNEFYSNFMVQVLNFDRIRLYSTNSIVTSNEKCYTKYYNYYLLGHDIIQLPKLVNRDGQLRYETYFDEEEVNVLDELKFIKKTTRTNELYKHLRGEVRK